MGSLLVRVAMAVLLCGPVVESFGVDAKSERAAALALDKKHHYKQMKGIAFHFCSCDVPCPCMFEAEEPDSCRIVRVLHITQGGDLGKVAVGKTIVIIPVRKHAKAEGETKREEESKGAVDGQDGVKNPDRIVYMSEELNEEQRRELRLQFDDLDIFLFGWATAEFRTAKIGFRKTDDGGYDVEIPGIFHATAQPVLGAGDRPIEAHNLGLSEGSDWFIGKGKVHEYQDPRNQDLKWSIPGKNGSWTFFETHYVQR